MFRARGNVVEGSKEQMAITYVKALRSEPLSLEQATPTITKLLSDKRSLKPTKKWSNNCVTRRRSNIVPYTAIWFGAIFESAVIRRCAAEEILLFMTSTAI